MTESTGFNEQEFSESFKLYNRTVVRPIQRNISNTLDKIFGMEGSITITPYSIDDSVRENNVE